MRNRRFSSGVVCLVVLLSGCGGSSDAGSPTSGVSMTQFAELPTRRCHTEVGYEGATAVPLDATSPTALPSSTPHGDLAAYRNIFGTTLIGPRAWHCWSGAGVDGSEFMVVSPRIVKGLDPAELGEEAVTLASIPACLACQAEQLCSLYPNAPPVKAYSPRLPCDEKPLNERTKSIGRYATTFEDPAGTKGLGVPSGGGVTAIGLLTYTEHGGVDKISCTLDDPPADICAAIAAAGIAPLVTR